MTGSHQTVFPHGSTPLDTATVPSGAPLNEMVAPPLNDGGAREGAGYFLLRALHEQESNSFNKAGLASAGPQYGVPEC